MGRRKIASEAIVIPSSKPDIHWQKRQILPSESAKAIAELCSPKVIVVFLQYVGSLTNPVIIPTLAQSEKKARIYEKAVKILTELKKRQELFFGDADEAVREMKQDAKLYPKLLAFLEDLSKNGGSLKGVSEKAEQLFSMLEKV